MVGCVEKGNEKETPFCLPKGLLSERDKPKRVHTVVYHTWISKCAREGKFFDFEGYRAPLVSFVRFKCRPLLSLGYNTLVNKQTRVCAAIIFCTWGICVTLFQILISYFTQRICHLIIPLALCCRVQRTLQFHC